ncbi:hypothetical protein CDAR_111181 [Caerostris darwini]|uniref:Uncharacterized protein n=1 Tax=Caerostris darwini TaxID=1538125 RepID=A0AAV4SQC3_9ARAC|nr:hypothetical protein CDAR_111181 [Caerostris darwini]
MRNRPLSWRPHCRKGYGQKISTSKDQIKQLKPLSCPPQQQRGRNFGVTYTPRHLATPKRLIPTKWWSGGGGFPSPISKTPFVNSFLNPWSSNRIEIARRVGSAELDSSLLRY